MSVDRSGLFESSTHNRHWLFASADLNKIREQVHKRAVERSETRRRSSLGTKAAQFSSVDSTPQSLVQLVQPGSDFGGRMSLGTDTKLPAPTPGYSGRMSLGTETKPPQPAFLSPPPNSTIPSTPDMVVKSLSFDGSPSDMSMTPVQASPVPIQDLNNKITFCISHESPTQHIALPTFLPTPKAPTPEMPPPQDTGKARKRGPPLTLEEEAKLNLFYTAMIRSISASFRFPTSVPGTACAFFKRFYLFNSMMNYQPKLIMATCINLACKAEESAISLDDLAKQTETKATTIVEFEVPVLEGLRFHLLVFHPYRPLRGLCKEIQKWEPKIGEEVLQEVRERAVECIEKSYYTDLQLRKTPSQIACAALHKVAREQNHDFVDRYLAQLPASPQDLRILGETITEIKPYLDHGMNAIRNPAALQEEVAVLNKKRIACSKNLFKLNNDKKNREKELRRVKKQEMRRKEEEERYKDLMGAPDDRDNDDFVIMSRSAKRAKPTPSPVARKPLANNNGH